ncbi:MAG: riboflavin synthase subunit alpha [Candidatus Melainabacteria bacterium GWF2_32_7]|nr:MAG: riboflavin synthase subunit alpha [Candidatus Melainabacteria bacterium GWF2_32_7]
MFTGIIEEIGTVRSIEKIAQGAVISINCSRILDDLNIGDSIAVNGACQTVVKHGSDSFDVEASPETMNLTTFKYFRESDKVNLERAMSSQSRFGGHMVTGHVDGIGEFREKVNQGIADLYYFFATNDIVKYMVYKGSITINGISLTIASLQENIFSISVISQTEKSTNLMYLKPGDKVNLESDIIAKYVEKFVSKSDNATGNINVNYLEQNGFI